MEHYTKLILLSVGSMLSTLAFANSHEDHCPDPSTLVYANSKWTGREEGNADATKKEKRTWLSDTKYPSPIDNPTIKFLDVYVVTENGNDPRKLTTSHVICTYKISNWPEIITLQPNGHHIYSGGIVNKKDKQGKIISIWKFFPYPNHDKKGEWHCNESAADCAFTIVEA